MLMIVELCAIIKKNRTRVVFFATKTVLFVIVPDRVHRVVLLNYNLNHYPGHFKS